MNTIEGFKDMILALQIMSEVPAIREAITEDKSQKIALSVLEQVKGAETIDEFSQAMDLWLKKIKARKEKRFNKFAAVSAGVFFERMDRTVFSAS